jgi:hypothetical protein
MLPYFLRSELAPITAMEDIDKFLSEAGDSYFRIRKKTACETQTVHYIAQEVKEA